MKKVKFEKALKIKGESHVNLWEKMAQAEGLASAESKAGSCSMIEEVSGVKRSE